jgi:2,3-bisphosphoglycerate-dependent phosphoglycerate mutase
MIATLESVLLIRHARSLGNDDPTLYLRVPDHAVDLSRPDDDPEAVAAAAHIAALGYGPQQVCSWSSPYLRCQRTQSLVIGRAFGAAACEVPQRESFLLREQEFGDWDGLTDGEIARRDPERHARRRLLADQSGRFYFRYPNGESRADVAQRVVAFIGKIHRSRVPVHIVFLHGVTQRALRMTWLNRSVAWFESEPNPPNASVLQIYRDPAGSWTERYLGPGPRPTA